MNLHLICITLLKVNTLSLTLPSSVTTEMSSAPASYQLTICELLLRLWVVLYSRYCTRTLSIQLNMQQLRYSKRLFFFQRNWKLAYRLQEEMSPENQTVLKYRFINEHMMESTSAAQRSNSLISQREGLSPIGAACIFFKFTLKHFRNPYYIRL